MKQTRAGWHGTGGGPLTRGSWGSECPYERHCVHLCPWWHHALAFIIFFTAAITVFTTSMSMCCLKKKRLLMKMFLEDMASRTMASVTTSVQQWWAVGQGWTPARKYYGHSPNAAKFSQWAPAAATVASCLLPVHGQLRWTDRERSEDLIEGTCETELQERLRSDQRVHVAS